MIYVVLLRFTLFCCDLRCFVAIYAVLLRFTLLCRDDMIVAKYALSQALLRLVLRHFELLQTSACTAALSCPTLVEFRSFFLTFTHFFVEFWRDRRLRVFSKISKILASSLFSFPCLSQILSSTPVHIYLDAGHMYII